MPDNASQIENSALFQSDVSALVTWSRNFDLKFNPEECCVIHFGKSNIKANYKMNNLDISKKGQEKDLGIVFSTKVQFKEHIHLISKKANKQLGIIKKVFTSRNPDTIISLYKSFVRPHLEYNSIISSPYTKKNEKVIEKIQKRLCNIIYGTRN